MFLWWMWWILQISIHVPLAGDDLLGVGFLPRGHEISIHVPLAGDDHRPCSVVLHGGHFYPRPPCGGRREIPSNAPVTVSLFLSTSPLRGTTDRRPGKGRHQPHFYPRPPCGGRPGATTPRSPARSAFLSTSPLRGTTGYRLRWSYNDQISIHVPLAGDDVRRRVRMGRSDRISIHVPLAGDDIFHPPPCGRGRYFYPRPPCGGRPARAGCAEYACGVFLSTSPLRGTT